VSLLGKRALLMPQHPRRIDADRPSRRDIGRETTSDKHDHGGGAKQENKALIDDYGGFENVVLNGTNEEALQRFAKSFDWPEHLLQKYPDPTHQRVDALKDFFAWSKGTGGIADFLRLQLGLAARQRSACNSTTGWRRCLRKPTSRYRVSVSDLLGTSARRMRHAVGDGETDPAALAALADQRLRATLEQLRYAFGACRIFIRFIGGW